MTQLGDVEQTFREARGQAVATLVRAFGDISLAEDAVQDAFTVALRRWPEDGIPPNPSGWIITTARNRAIDSLRRSERGEDLEREAADLFASVPREVGPVSDDRLRLIFTCCHPALRQEHQVALTLRLLGGLEVDEIARAFLVGEGAMAKRLVRAKHKIKAANIPYRIPGQSDLPDRVQSALHVLYLIYNAGSDDRTRMDMRREAIRLIRQLADLMPDEPEASGLLALVLLNESRMPARSHDSHVTLAEQDRTLWNRDLIEEGQSIVRACIRRNRPGPFQIQAAIQAVHSDANDIASTDWRQILTLYDQLITLMPTAVVAMNRAIALAEVEGPTAGLSSLDQYQDELESYHLFHAARAAMLRSLDQIAEADAALERAVDLAPTSHDRRFLESQITRSTV